MKNHPFQTSTKRERFSLLMMRAPTATGGRKVSQGTTPIESLSRQVRLSFNQKKIHLIFSSQKRLDNFCKSVFAEKDISRYEEAIKDRKKSPSSVFQELLSSRLGLDIVGKDNIARGSSLTIDIIDAKIQLSHIRIEDSMCVMFFPDEDTEWLRESIHSRLKQSIVAEFPAVAQQPPSFQESKNLHLFNPIGDGISEAKLCLAILHSLTFVKVDGDLILSIEDIEKRIWNKKHHYELVKDQDYKLFMSCNSIFIRWKNHLSSQKILLDGIINPVMPFPPFASAPRSEYHNWLDTHCELIKNLDYTPSDLVQNSLNRIHWLTKISDPIRREHNQRAKCSYEVMVKNNLGLSMTPPPLAWEEIHKSITKIYESDDTKNHNIFTGLSNIQRHDSGFETYAQFEEWTLDDKERAGLLINLNPKYWKDFHFLNIALMMDQKYGEKIDKKPDSNHEIQELTVTKIHGFNQHSYWIQTLQRFQNFSAAGGRLS